MGWKRVLALVAQLDSMCNVRCRNAVARIVGQNRASRDTTLGTAEQKSFMAAVGSSQQMLRS